MISILRHPHSCTPAINLNGKELAGAYLISPWVTAAATGESFKYNVGKDYIHPPRLGVIGNQYTSVVDDYSWPLIASAEWWKDIQVKDVMTVAGEYEVFRSDIKEFAEKVKVSLFEQAHLHR